MSSIAPVVRAFRLTTSADLQATWAAFSDTERGTAHCPACDVTYDATFPDARWPDAESMRHALAQVLIGLQGHAREVEAAWQRLRAERTGSDDDERPTTEL